ncbi:hypothetical protein [Colwellia psychrerythraea]|uniref:Lipoprotein n=1 Tax=Colwellia psychrerythraea TaxID=28229 RepID=A0A099KLL1_COLPS|nr:hypothetical protein [Colwellia psychrerythraea]KGJ91624.1 hypothetical protein GAB14E_3106 [Colwellia psychrerythraea]
MKKQLNLLLVVFVCYASPSHAWWLASTNSTASINPSKPAESNKAHNEWLKKRFSKQHQALIPVVAVADMFFSCNQVRKTDKVDYNLKHLITEMDKNILAEKLANCLGGDAMQSDTALNFGLFGCFQQQLAHLPKTEREQKMLLVKQAVSSLSHEERKKSFTQCVTEQSIHYLK